jgi:LemA protein
MARQGMTSSIGSSAAIALTAFALLWAFGAYNRLMRERAKVIRAFADLGQVVEERAAVLLAVSHAQLLHTGQAQSENLWHRMEACVQQAANAVAHAHVKPMDGERIAAVRAALRILDESLEAVQSHGIAQAHAPWPLEVQHQLARCDARLLTQSERFDVDASTYNESIAQFPTLVVARLFGLRATQTLQRHSSSI